eukprot:scaffold75133_cov21-Prasinocladus_malaysianus.AAC.1
MAATATLSRPKSCLMYSNTLQAMSVSPHKQINEKINDKHTCAMSVRSFNGASQMEQVRAV